MPRPVLSRQRRAALVGLANGLSIAEIASRMFLSEGTVYSHLSACRRILGVHTRSHAVARALKLGLIGLNEVVDEGECPGVETVPNYCRCPCYGCKHHCGAHEPLEDDDAR